MSVRQEVVITNSHGLHARPAAELVALMASFDAGVKITVGDKSANASSIMSLLALGASTGSTAEINAEGPDAAAAMDAVVGILTMED